jgi:hypothetical protein
MRRETEFSKNSKVNKTTIKQNHSKIVTFDIGHHCKRKWEGVLCWFIYNVSILKTKIQFIGVSLIAICCIMQRLNISIAAEVRGHFPRVIFGCMCVKGQSNSVDERPRSLCRAIEKCWHRRFHWLVAEAGG